MKFTTLVIGTLLLSSCYTSRIHQYASETWEGRWYGNGDKESVLSIRPTGSDAFELSFEHRGVRWDGIGYEADDELLAVFRYRGTNDQGYITFRLVTRGRADFTSYDSDGTYRAGGTVFREIRR